ncbi:hypothetical protein [Aporhodopirellula aestuarii]|uniref:Macro domain-containing protein n=1 Tax=Aporhodopirellula aestuarii TaxID=2950107 RepID=A0ABT0U705_9BACT|nr:hypothetical protein [Aporhodopirellula aestuarii]MCM2372710.1 hypothetical protein [Aporhodopirellula aestuarii]
MTWFQQLTGIDERSPDHVRSQINVDDGALVMPNGKRIAFGRLETPTLGELRSQASIIRPAGDGLRLREVVGDVRKLHADPANAGSLFQVASQFNLLEMAGPSVTPERGVGVYENDLTQGPACAISCGSGTIYRNYFAPVGDSIGQTAQQQIDCSADLGQLLGNASGTLWKMQNGYLFPTDSGLEQVATKLQRADDGERDRYRESLRIGVQWNTAVTLPGCDHRVSQAYCSALPVAYGRQPANQWTQFARLVLEAAYEATLCAAILNDSPQVFLTLLGGGVFGNEDQWIIGAIERAIEKARQYDLDVAIVSYGSSQRVVAELVTRFGGAA